ncbi:MAG: hypothetical protein ACLVF9_11245 [Enterocloster sp.]
MGKKKLQGADGINFQMQLTIKGLETVTFPKETLTNESGKDIAWIECLGGKVSAYVNLPHAVRPNNIQPFQLSDCIQIDLISDKVIEYMKAYLKKHMKGNYSNEILKQLNVSSMECNITIKCVGNCKPKDVINLFEKSVDKTFIAQEARDKKKTFRKDQDSIIYRKDHYYRLKVYNKSKEQNDKGNPLVESNLIRVEFVFLERMLDSMYADRMSLEDILTRKSLRKLIDQYQETFTDICEKNIKPMLNGCVQEVFECLTTSNSGKEISETLYKCKECIVDVEVLRKALKKWYAFKKQGDRSKQVIAYYRENNFGMPEDVIRTVKQMHNSL